MGKLFINEQGFVDLRKNPPATRVQVQGGTTALEEPPRKMDVEMIPEPPATPREEPLPGRQKTTEGLEVSVAGPVKIRKNAEVPHRIESASGEKCYAIVSKANYQKLSMWHWVGHKMGKMYRRVPQGNGKPDLIRWLHRDACNCNRDDKFVAFLDGDERNLLKSNTRIVDSKEAAREIRRQALQRSAHGH